MPDCKDVTVKTFASACHTLLVLVLTTAVTTLSGSAVAEDVEIYIGQSLGISIETQARSNQLPGSAHLKSVEYGSYLSEAGVGPSSATTQAAMINHHRIVYEEYHGGWNSLPNFDRLAAVSTGTLGTFSVLPATRSNNYAFRYTAVLNVPATGSYQFYLNSGDGARLYVDGTQVVNGDGLHAATEYTGAINLTAGQHNLMVTYFQRSATAALSVEWSGPGIHRRPVESYLAPLPNYNALSYEYYQGLWRYLPDFDTLTPVSTGRVNNFSLAPRARNEEYGFRYTGRISVPADGNYTFYIGSDDGSQLFINGTMLINNDGLHGYRERSGLLYLTAGVHDLVATMFERHGGDNLTVKWQGPNINKQDLSPWLVGSPGGSTTPARVKLDNKAYSPNWLHESASSVSATSSSLAMGAAAQADYWEMYYAGRTDAGNNIVELHNSDSGRVMSGAGSVVADRSAWGEDHKWELLPQSDGTYVFRTLGGSYLDGWNYRISLYGSGVYSEQKWSLELDSSGIPANLFTHSTPRDWKFIPVSTSADGNNIVRLQGKLSSYYAAADYLAASSSNAYPQVQTDSDELWEMIPLGTGRYHIRNVNDGRYLHAQGPGMNDNVSTVIGTSGSWIYCAGENSNCSFTGTRQVRYGAQGEYAIAEFTDGTSCSNAVFGDPISGVYKSCHYLDTSGSALTQASEWQVVATGVSGNPPAPPNPGQPNILFILDASGSMGWTDTGETGTRMERMKTALGLVMDNINNVNVGLMRYSHSYSGGRIVYPVSPIDQSRNDLTATVNSMVANHGTPSVGALYEAARYFRGEGVEFGKSRAARTNYSGVNFSRVSHPQSYDGGTVVRASGCTDDDLNNASCGTERIDGSPVYKSPIVSECQANYIVMLTDGQPTTTAIPEAESLIGGTCADASSRDGKCGAEVANFLNTTDQSVEMDGDNTIVTHTIGFNFTTEWLKEVAAAGGGKFYTADSALDLLTAIESIILEAKTVENTIVAPAATLDQTSRLAHRDDVYLALFEPSYSPAWQGNLKRYYFDGELKDDSDPRKLAIDPATGSFYDNAQSFWSAAPDGPNVGQGGAASQLNRDTRRVTTYFPGNPKALLNSANAIDRGNVHAADLGLPDDALGLSTADTDKLVDWASGIDVLDFDEDGLTTDTRHYIGDPLHTTPVIVTYDWNGSEPDSLVFFGTNEGYLHAIDTVTGAEHFSYIPESLLPILKHRYANTAGKPKVYGLDGPLTLWAYDKNGDKAINGSGDFAWLFAGMRRGGRAYHALDVTNRNDPEFLWRIDGGTGAFTQLGQSWSKPVATKIVNPVNNRETNVLIFGGGYDLQQDNVSTRTTDSMGLGLFIVDAATGALIWRGGSDIGADEIFPKMQYSIPSDPRVIDINGDGLADQIYVGDMGGQVWRFDIDNHSGYVSNLVTGGVIAELADDTAEGNRRFYNAPDVSVVRRDGEQVMMISIGSGYRAHPLDKVIDDRFYVIQQSDFKNGKPAGYGMLDAGTYRPIGEGDLFDVTDNVLGQGSDLDKLTARQALAISKGWYLSLEDPGEKSLSSSITANSQVFFTTYTPSEGGNVCAPNIGSGKLYVMNILDGTPSLHLSEENGGPNDPLTIEDRQQDLMRPGIPPSPRVLFPENESPVLLIGPEEGPSIELGKLAKRVSWVEVAEF
jgi:type IV pilus assembly protein PilY1